jgi:hypothetical protein
MFHDYLDYNPSRVQVLAERAERKERAHKAAETRWGKKVPSTTADATKHANEHATKHPSEHAGKHAPSNQPQHPHADAPGPGPGPGPVPSPDPDPKPPTQLSLRSGESDITTANDTPEPRRKSTKYAQIVRVAQEVLDTWITAREGRFTTTKNHRPRLNEERIESVSVAIGNGYAIESLKLAVRGFVLNSDNKHASRAEGFCWSLEPRSIDNNIDIGQKAANIAALAPHAKEVG